VHSGAAAVVIVTSVLCAPLGFAMWFISTRAPTKAGLWFPDFCAEIKKLQKNHNLVSLACSMHCTGHAREAP
tara:strand:+ start:32051 stop:32266 length:216 start_codon:yes stop_codon:yes gene_type:complete